MDPCTTGIAGILVEIDETAVRVVSERPLTVLSSAVVGGGVCRTHDIVNMHVGDGYDGSRPADDLARFAASAGIGTPFVGLMTAAHTEYAHVATESQGGLSVAAVVSVGLSNTACAGLTPPMPARPGTINTILLVEAALSPGAMVNAVITATEAKTMTLAAWNVCTPQGEPASGTSTDSVVVACMGEGNELEYAGPATPAGWLIARAVRRAITQICREKCARDGGRRIGW